MLPALCAAVVLVPVTAARSAEPRDTTRAQEPADMVAAALRGEPSGGGDDRFVQLHAAIERDPQFAPARWQAGQVEWDGRWIDFSRVPGTLAAAENVQRYRDERDKRGDTYADHIALADFCRRHTLPVRERAHVLAALELADDPDDPRLRARLGQRQVGGVWMTEEESRQRQDAAEQVQRDRTEWLPRLRRIGGQLVSARADVAEAARQELLAIDDPDALPALEAALSNGERQAAVLVELLRDMDTHEAADYLARQATMSPFPTVRTLAADALRDRPIEAYAPELLATLRTPAESRTSLFVSRGSVHLLQEVTSETQTRRQTARVGTRAQLMPVPLTAWADPKSSLTDPINMWQNLAFGGQAQQAAALGAQRQAARANAELARQNEAIAAWNQRVCTTLATATGLQLPAEPQPWWEWWQVYNQLDEEEKEEERREYYATVTEFVPQDLPLPPTPIQTPTPVPTPPIRPAECLVAGTPVWTDRGAVAVQEVRVGDLVLARHPESGELAYKPVLRTTVRDDEPVFHCETAEGDFRATGGHPFWVSGRGWVKLRDARPGMHFHGAAGPIEVRRVTPDGEEKTYNLVTEDFHTYFVGDGLILSHDVTFAEPVDALVPGLAAR
jgi:hypothetical protein